MRLEGDGHCDDGQGDERPWPFVVSLAIWAPRGPGSPIPVPFPQQVSKTYSSLNWESVTYLNCFSDLIRIFHLQQAILKYCLYTNSHSE